MNSKKTIKELISTIMSEMEKEHFSKETRRQYKDVYNRLQRLDDNHQEVFYNMELGQAFIEDCNYAWKKDTYSNHRFYFHKRCILILERLITTGKVDLSKCIPNNIQSRSFAIKTFELIYKDYIQLLQEEGIKPSTICSYARASFYLLKYLEEKRYHSLDDLLPGDVTNFFLVMCKVHWDPKCLGSYISGVKKLLKMSVKSSVYIREIPSHMPRKKEIIEVYTDEEYIKILSYLDNADISKRDKAISILAIETGMRAIDINNLKIRDVDWKYEFIHLIQEKTGHTLDIPLRASYGNAMMDYLLEERQDSKSAFFFLQCKAPYGKIMSHSCIFKILQKIVKNAGVESSGRINGTRMMRHNAASRMVRKGVRLSAIAGVLGHRDPNSTMTYISTDREELSRCTLPLPGGTHE